MGIGSVAQQLARPFEPSLAHEGRERITRPSISCCTYRSERPRPRPTEAALRSGSPSRRANVLRHGLQARQAICRQTRRREQAGSQDRARAQATPGSASRASRASEEDRPSPRIRANRDRTARAPPRWRREKQVDGATPPRRGRLLARFPGRSLAKPRGPLRAREAACLVEWHNDRLSRLDATLRRC